MDKVLQILYLEDNPADAGLTQYALRRTGLSFNMHVIDTEREYRKALIDFKPDLILSDHSLPGFSSIEAYKIMKENACDTPFILLTGSVSEQFAVDCLLAGIDDYILKDNLIRLPSSIERVLAKKRVTLEKETIESLHKELQSVYKQLEEKNRETIDSINYAKRIQNTILPDETEFKKWAINGFVIYSPRDIVSGDLYWLATTTPLPTPKTWHSNLWRLLIAQAMAYRERF